MNRPGRATSVALSQFCCPDPLGEGIDSSSGDVKWNGLDHTFSEFFQCGSTLCLAEKKLQFSSAVVQLWSACQCTTAKFLSQRKIRLIQEAKKGEKPPHTTLNSAVGRVNYPE